MIFMTRPGLKWCAAAMQRMLSSNVSANAAGRRGTIADERHAITDLTDLRCALAFITLAVDVVPAVDLDLVKYYCNQVCLRPKHMVSCYNPPKWTTM